MKKRGQLNLANILILAIAFFFLFPVIAIMQAGIATWTPGQNSFVDAMFTLAPPLVILIFIALFAFFVFPRRSA